MFIEGVNTVKDMSSVDGWLRRATYAEIKNREGGFLVFLFFSYTWKIKKEISTLEGTNEITTSDSINFFDKATLK